MNREIKFRAWNKTECEWMAVSNLVVAEHLPTGSLSLQINPCMDNEEIDIQLTTGLKDKNGKEIYEGDIVETFKDEHNTDYLDNPSVWVSVVIFNSMTAGFEIEEREVGEFEEFYSRESFAFADYLAGEGHKSIKVIGNIYENKGLLKGGDDE